jgi:hypothetical protein
VAASAAAPGEIVLIGPASLVWWRASNNTIGHNISSGSVDSYRQDRPTLTV